MNALPAILLVPVDGSKGAGTAAKLAAELADRLQIPIRLLFAFPKNATEMFGVPTDTSNRTQLQYFSPEVFEELRNDSAKQAFLAAKEAIGEMPGVTIEEKLLTGDPAQSIVEHANQEPGAMLVMGRRGLSRVKSVLLGSVSQRVAHHAGCPVILSR